jgi:16S rRNA (cytosine1402-N4)-methyltransferase
VDRDVNAIRTLQATFAGKSVEIIQSDFHAASQTLASKGRSYDVILADLGVSSPHLDNAGRGFSISADGPLDMRFDRTHGQTARDLVMHLEDRELVRIFSLYGEEKKSWFIANEIIKRRKVEPIDTTEKLVEIIRSASYDDKSPLRVFQALRIAVNEEFAHIEKSLKQALELLEVGGLIAVITFHSLEDRLVKNIFSPYLEDTIDPVTGQIREKARFAKYTKKPIIPTEKEVENNPRSRSAKMRVIKRIY